MAGPGSYQPKLKTYTMEEVAKHKSKEEGLSQETLVRSV